VDFCGCGATFDEADFFSGEREGLLLLPLLGCRSGEKAEAEAEGATSSRSDCFFFVVLKRFGSGIEGSGHRPGL
jgi:hypothetical protein